METSIKSGPKAQVKWRKKCFYHQPPTAVPVKLRDLQAALRALRDPKGNLEQFASVLAKWTGSSNCFLTSSGRSALRLILLFLKKNSTRKNVILPAYSCPTVTQAVLSAGLNPIFCDVEPNTLDLNRVKLTALLNDQVLAILPTHLYGLAQDISDLVKLCQELNIIIIEDAAQAFGSRIHGQMVGTGGDFGIFSMGRGKCIPTGQGGVIIAKDRYISGLTQTLLETITTKSNQELTSIFKFMAYGLATTPIGWWFIVHSPLNPAREGLEIKSLPPISFNSFPGTQAGIGISILNRIDQINKIRRRNARLLYELLSNCDYVHVPEIPSGSEPVYLRFPIIVDNENRTKTLFQQLAKVGIGVSRSYAHTLPDLYAHDSVGNTQDFPGATHLANCLLTLPTHPFMRTNDFFHIQNIFSSF